MKILVLGESCRDEFVYCNATRLAPDIPVPVLNALHKVENDGMAANVYNNIKSDYDGVVELGTNPNWKDITKTRYVHEGTNHTFFRVDVERIVWPYTGDGRDLFDYDIMVISDYDKGFLSRETIELLCYYNTVFLDTKKPLDLWAAKAKYIKINDYEYHHSDSKFIQGYSDKIIHTDGANGCWFQGEQYPVNRVEVKDSSGAGDAFMAALVSEYARGENIISSIKYANSKASEVVKHRGVTTI